MHEWLLSKAAQPPTISFPPLCLSLSVYVLAPPLFGGARFGSAKLALALGKAQCRRQQHRRHQNCLIELLCSL